jgi:hypothetical protein
MSNLESGFYGFAFFYVPIGAISKMGAGLVAAICAASRSVATPATRSRTKSWKQKSASRRSTVD